VLVRQRLPVALLLPVVVVLLFAPVGSTSGGQEGGTFKIAFAPQAGLDRVDPALSFTQPGWAVLDAVCARLMTHPDKNAPKSFGLVPEVATAPPKTSKDFKTFTFTLRRNFKFSDGKPLRASAFAQAIYRTLAPGVNSPGALFTRDIVGAADVLAGRRKKAPRGVSTPTPYTLVIELTRPAADFAARTSLPFFCAVPPGLPPNPEGVGPFSSAGPFYVFEYRPDERVVLRRNTYYGGSRPVRVDGFDVDLRAPNPTEMIRMVDRGDADWGHAVSAAFMDPTINLVGKYGVNRSRFFVKPGLTVRMLAFNSSRGLFKNNPKLRRAINFALDRLALRAPVGGPMVNKLTDQYLPPALPGFRNADIYPLAGPDLVQARALAKDNLRGRKAIFYVPIGGPPAQIAQAVQQQLAAIGLEVEVRTIPWHTVSAEYLNLLAKRGEKWDLALVIWSPHLADPYAYINLLLETQFVGGSTLTGFNSRTFRRLIQRAASLPTAIERRKAYGDLDVRLARNLAPLAALSVADEATLVSDRVGCIILRPVLDLATVCLKN
jgi:peptide/nickel transport system substrate-binding protein